LTESSGIFDNGWGNRNYGFAFDAENPLIPVQCNWVVSPSIALDQIESSKRKVLGVFLKLNFLTFDVARSNPICTYELIRYYSLILICLFSRLRRRHTHCHRVDIVIGSNTSSFNFSELHQRIFDVFSE
jgi:hypothetical protein